MAKTNYKAQIMKLSGLNEAEYKRESAKWRAQVRNYNRATGSEISAVKTMYNKFKYPDTPSRIIQGISATPATRSHKAGDPYDAIKSGVAVDIGERTFRRSFADASVKSVKVQKIFEQLDKDLEGAKGDIKKRVAAVEKAKNAADEWSKELRKRRDPRQGGSATAGYDD